MYCGKSSSILVSDNGNIFYLLLILILLPTINRIAGPEPKTLNISIASILLLIGISFCSWPQPLLEFLTYHEFSIYSLLFISPLFIPPYHRIRTTSFSFLFPILGTISSIIPSLFYLISEWLPRSLPTILPLYIKIPCYPSFHRLPEVHREVNSSIPSYLAGSLSKSGIFGITRSILVPRYL